MSSIGDGAAASSSASVSTTTDFALRREALSETISSCESLLQSISKFKATDSSRLELLKKRVPPLRKEKKLLREEELLLRSKISELKTKLAGCEHRIKVIDESIETGKKAAKQLEDAHEKELLAQSRKEKAVEALRELSKEEASAKAAEALLLLSKDDASSEKESKAASEGGIPRTDKSYLLECNLRHEEWERLLRLLDAVHEGTLSREFVELRYGVRELVEDGSGSFQSRVREASRLTESQKRASRVIEGTIRHESNYKLQMEAIPNEVGDKTKFRIRSQIVSGGKRPDRFAQVAFEEAVGRKRVSWTKAAASLVKRAVWSEEEIAKLVKFGSLARKETNETVAKQLKEAFPGLYATKTVEQLKRKVLYFRHSGAIQLRHESWKDEEINALMFYLHPVDGENLSELARGIKGTFVELFKERSEEAISHKIRRLREKFLEPPTKELAHAAPTSPPQTKRRKKLLEEDAGSGGKALSSSI